MMCPQRALTEIFEFLYVNIAYVRYPQMRIYFCFFIMVGQSSSSCIRKVCFTSKTKFTKNIPKGRVLNIFPLISEDNGILDFSLDVKHTFSDATRRVLFNHHRKRKKYSSKILNCRHITYSVNTSKIEYLGLRSLWARNI